MTVDRLLAPFAIAAAATLAAEQQPIRTGTNVVRVDVTVLDRRGEPVTSRPLSRRQGPSIWRSRFRPRMGKRSIAWSAGWWCPIPRRHS